MERLIDADKLLTNVVSVSNSKGQVTWSAVSTMDILTAPTVDAVEVVRCKDCERVHRDPYSGCYYCEERYVPSTHFCSYGERKDGDGNGG